jgi:creatinine amidohydrolase
MEVCLSHFTSREAGERAASGAVVVLPVGSTEQHGAHLPLDTDTFLVSAVAKGAAASVCGQVPVVVAPPVAVACSLHHMEYAGTLSLEFETFIAAVYEIAVSLARHGFRKLLLLNGHGGNTAGLTIVANKLMVKNILPLVVTANYWSLIADEVKTIRETGPGGMGHACEFETSLSLYLRPELVQSDKMVCSIPAPRLPGDSLDLVQGGSIGLPWLVHKDTPLGVVGNPLVATKEKGRLLFDASVRRVGQLIADMYNKND